MDAYRAAELAARTAYGRLLAYLVARWRDVMMVEDALSEAFLAALEQWPQIGVPANPDAWLLVIARRRLIDYARRTKVRAEVSTALEEIDELIQSQATISTITLPDERLQLLFTCAHPAIDSGIRTPLMLQTVLGLNAERIASAFLVAPTTMGQRLVRAKAKIRDAGIRFEVPEPSDLRARLGSVLQAIYAAYGTGWDDISGADARLGGLADEAIWLGRLTLQLMPDEPEVKGLLALMCHCEARRPARLTARQHYVPLYEQDVQQWSLPLIAEAEQLLLSAATANRVGRFQLEAAIQSAHMHGVTAGQTDWATIVLLYEGLTQQSPTIGAFVGQAAATAEARGPKAGLHLLATLPADAIKSYQPYWTLMGHLYKQSGEPAMARAAYQRAIGLTEDSAVRTFLLQQVGD